MPNNLNKIEELPEKIKQKLVEIVAGIVIQEKEKWQRELAEKIKGNEFENEIHLILTSAIIDKHRYQIVNAPDILAEIRKEILELLKEK